MKSTTDNYFNNVPEDRIFKSEIALEDEFIPSRKNFVCRETEIKQIVSKLSSLSQGGYGKNFIATGNTGYGKTACVRIVLKDLKEQMQQNGQNLEYIHTDDNTSERQALRSISRNLSLDYRGNDLSKYYVDIEDKVNEENLSLVIVLDEMDKLFQEEGKEHGNSLLKRLYETRQRIVNSGNGSLVIIGITNNVNVQSLLDSKNSSRYQDRTVHFSAYDCEEIKKILELRAQLAFQQGVLEEGVMSKISAIVGRESGDARSAIEILRVTGEMAVDRDASRIPKRYVDEAKTRLMKNKTLDAIEKLPNHGKILLFSQLSSRNKKNKTSQLIDQYQKVCDRESIEPVSERQVRSILKDLSMMGLIDMEYKTISETGGRTREISSPHEEELGEEIMKYIQNDQFGYEFEDENE